MPFNKKKFKNDLDVHKKEKSPLERELELIQNSNTNSNFLPKPLGFEDVDSSVFKEFFDGDLSIEIDGKKVPVAILNTERWYEFSQTWSFSDEDKNLLMPYITFRRVNTKRGEYSGVKWSIPNRKTFLYSKIPIFENGFYGYEVYKVPQPIPVDFFYEVRLFTKYMEDVNTFNKMMFKQFAGQQHYINVKGQYFRIIQEDNDENNTNENIDGDRFYNPIFKIKCMAYILDETEFEITKTKFRITNQFNFKDSNDTILESKTMKIMHDYNFLKEK